MIATDILMLVVSFFAIWLSAGVAITAVEASASRLRLSKFALSLFVLGTVTSLPEIGVTINAIALQAPQIAVGNLIGGQIFILFLVIPLLVVLSRGLRLRVQLQGSSLALTLLVILAPILAFIDQKMSLSEALVILGIYIVFTINFARKSSLVERVVMRLTKPNRGSLAWQLVKIVGAIIVLLIASNFAVKGIIELSSALSMPGFLVSLVILPLGTNLPELSLAIKGVMFGKKDVALGDFVGSMTFNSLLLFILAIAYGADIVIGQSITSLIVFLVLGIFLFWYFCQSQKYLSFREGIILLIYYFSFVGIATVLGLDGFFNG